MEQDQRPSQPSMSQQFPYQMYSFVSNPAQQIATQHTTSDARAFCARTELNQHSDLMYYYVQPPPVLQLAPQVLPQTPQIQGQPLQIVQLSPQIIQQLYQQAPHLFVQNHGHQSNPQAPSENQNIMQQMHQGQVQQVQLNPQILKQLFHQAPQLFVQNNYTHQQNHDIQSSQLFQQNSQILQQSHNVQVLQQNPPAHGQTHQVYQMNSQMVQQSPQFIVQNQQAPQLLPQALQTRPLGRKGRPKNPIQYPGPRTLANNLRNVNPQRFKKKEESTIVHPVSFVSCPQNHPDSNQTGGTTPQNNELITNTLQNQDVVFSSQNSSQTTDSMPACVEPPGMNQTPILAQQNSFVLQEPNKQNATVLPQNPMYFQMNPQIAYVQNQIDVNQQVHPQNIQAYPTFVPQPTDNASQTNSLSLNAPQVEYRDIGIQVEPADLILQEALQQDMLVETDSAVEDVATQNDDSDEDIVRDDVEINDDLTAKQSKKAKKSHRAKKSIDKACERILKHVIDGHIITEMIYLTDEVKDSSRQGKGFAEQKPVSECSEHTECAVVVPMTRERRYSEMTVEEFYYQTFSNGSLSKMQQGSRRS